MTIPGLFKEYIWLIETINRYGKITFAELNELWKRKEGNAGVEFSRTTFNRHRDAILDMFGLIIECDRRAIGLFYLIITSFNKKKNSLHSTWGFILPRNADAIRFFFIGKERKRLVPFFSLLCFWLRPLLGFASAETK